MNLPVILKNKYVLYAVLFIAITNVLGFLQRQDFRSLSMFIVIGLLSTHFSKNMTVNLLMAIVITNLVNSSKSLREGMTDKAKKNKAKKGKGKKSNDKKENADFVAWRLSDNKCSGSSKKCDDDDTENTCFDSLDKCNAAGKKEKFSQSNVPSSKPASIDSNDDDDDAPGKRIDYAATLEQAYDNLEKMLGSDGLKGLTNETKQLVGQQQNLMKTLNNMAPILNNAKQTLSDLNMPSIDKLQDVMKSLNGQQANEK